MSNPFEEEEQQNNIELNIEIWSEEFGRKKITYISGWAMNNDIKEDLKVIKKKLATSASIKDNIVQLQGEHILYMVKYLKTKGIENVKIR